VICGVHFPSDVQAGQVLAAAVVARLDASADFQADLARARAEYSAH
jgi:acid phosphatase (class A)